MQTVQMLDVVYGAGALLCSGAVVLLPDSVADPLIQQGKAIRVGGTSAFRTVETAALTPGPMAEFRKPSRSGKQRL